MEFEKKSAEMILVKTSPEELKTLAAIMRACHEFDEVLCEMGGDDLLNLANRLEKAKEDSWVFHEIEILYLYNILILARSLDAHKVFQNVSDEAILQLWADLKKIDKIRHSV